MSYSLCPDEPTNGHFYLLLFFVLLGYCKLCYPHKEDRKDEYQTRAFALGLLWLLCSSKAVHADELTVCPPGVATCNYYSAQDAVDAANAGDSILVAIGVYTGVQARPAPPGYEGPSVISQTVYITKSLILQGGYDLAFTEPPDPDAHPSTLDVLGEGRGIFVAGPAVSYCAALSANKGCKAGRQS